jgi:hypothetical protein
LTDDFREPGPSAFVPSVVATATDGGKRVSLYADRVRTEHGSRVHEDPLADPATPGFLRLPRLTLDDGRPLRRAAFDTWTANVRASVAGGREFEATYRSPRPINTALAMGGGGAIAAFCTTLLLAWAFRPVPAVEVRPSTAESAVLLLSVAVIVGIIVVSAAAAVRAWRCRRGSYVEITARGIRATRGGRHEPFDVVAAAEHHGLLRCTRIEFMDGRADLWVPDEPGPLRRLDLLLAAMDERLGVAVRSRL